VRSVMILQTGISQTNDDFHSFKLLAVSC
jgi:hypothetical protein